jgi:PTH1 family peptidyl-tRNA hydrolase
MKLIAGLGNPGREYEKTRHNSGFLAMDRIADKLHADVSEEKFEALIAKVRVGEETVLLMKPLTFMNESGRAVVQAAAYYRIEPKDILVLHDDMDLPVGSVRIRTKGSSGGQKGMNSIIQALGTQEISRIRIGTDHDRKGDVPDFVLSPVPKAQQEEFQKALEIAADAAVAWITTPMDKVMNRYNTKEKASADSPATEK